MKHHSLIITAIVSIFLIQSTNIVALTSTLNVAQSPSLQGGQANEERGDPVGATQRDRLESIAPRHGLQSYFEITGAGLIDLARVGNGTTSLGKLLASGPLNLTAADLAGFVLSNAAALSKTRVALANYGTDGTALLLEAANEADAIQLGRATAKLIASRQLSGKAEQSDLRVGIRARIMIAARQSLVTRLIEPNGERILAGDREFMKARSRFSEEPLFAFVELSTGIPGLPAASGSTDVAQTQAMIAAMSGMPYAMAFGGSFHGDSAVVRALLINGSKPVGGPFSGVLGSMFLSAASSATHGQSNAAKHVPSNADIFVDLTLDWEKFLDSIQSVFAYFSSLAVASASQTDSAAVPRAEVVQSADFLTMAESALGFSFKHDLIPTLGNEVAFAISGLETPSPRSPTSNRRNRNRTAKKSSPKFILMVAVRDEAKFDNLLATLIAGPKATSPPLSRSSYRGVAIKSGKSVAYAITGGFLLIAGSGDEIRHALDAHAMGDSLASVAEFNEVLSNAPQATMQAYLSSRFTKEIMSSVFKETDKNGGGSEHMTAASAKGSSAIGLSLAPDEDGLMIEARLPANLVAMALTAMLNARPASYGIGVSPSTGVSDSGSRRTGTRATPKMTEDDVRRRRP